MNIIGLKTWPTNSLQYINILVLFVSTIEISRVHLSVGHL